MGKFKEFLKTNVSEETTTADIASVDSRLGAKDKVQKRPKTKVQGREDEIENDEEEDSKKHYEDLMPSNKKSKEVIKQLSNGDK